MPWSAIVLAVIGLVGPLITRLLEEWLDAQLRAAVPRVGRVTGDREADTRRLLTAVRSQLWFWQLRKKRFVDQLLADTPQAVAAGTFAPAAARAVTAAAFGA